MITRRHLLAGLATTAIAHPVLAQEWKSKYPELVFAVIPAENASGVTDRYGPFVSYLSNELGTRSPCALPTTMRPLSKASAPATSTSACMARLHLRARSSPVSRLRPSPSK